MRVSAVRTMRLWIHVLREPGSEAAECHEVFPLQLHVGGKMTNKRQPQHDSQRKQADNSAAPVPVWPPGGGRGFVMGGNRHMKRLLIQAAAG